MRRPSPRARWARPCHCGRSGARVCRPPTMIPGVRGRLITASFARDVLPSMPGFASPPSSMSPRLGRWAVRLEASLGTTSSVRAIADVALAPLLDLLGLIGVQRIESEHSCALRLTAGGSACLSALTIGWGEPIDRMWRSVVTDGIGSDARWCLCCNGQVLRLVDARRTWSREYLEFDLAQLGHEREAQAVFWALLHAGALTGATPLLDRAVDLSCRHGLEVCKALGAGVLEACSHRLCRGRAARHRFQRTALCAGAGRSVRGHTDQRCGDDSRPDGGEHDTDQSPRPPRPDRLPRSRCRAIRRRLRAGPRVRAGFV